MMENGDSERLKRRAEHAFSYLMREVNAVSAEEAVRDRHARWPGQRWGIGQDGSIAGIVAHVAAWKRLTLPALCGADPEPMTTVPYYKRIEPDDWIAARADLSRIGQTWNNALLDLPEATFERELTFEGNTITISKLVEELADHDIQHAAQIEYLRQRHLADGTVGRELY